jgi:hypothetical protein
MIATLDDYKDQVLPRVRESGNHTDEASFLVALGNMYVAEGHRAKGIQQHQQAIHILESFGEWTEAARVSATIAKVYQAAGD